MEQGRKERQIQRCRPEVSAIKGAYKPMRETDTYTNRKCTMHEVLRRGHQAYKWGRDVPSLKGTDSMFLNGTMMSCCRIQNTFHYPA